MSNWKATLPRELPPDGKQHVVCAMKNSKGTRIELVGVVDDETAKKVMQLLVAAISKDSDHD